MYHVYFFLVFLSIMYHAAYAEALQFRCLVYHDNKEILKERNSTFYIFPAVTQRHKMLIFG